MRHTTCLLTSIALASLLAACAGAPKTVVVATAAKPFDQSALPAAVQVPAGHVVALETVGAGSITYECRAKANMADQFEWVFVGPEAKLSDRSGKQIGT